MKRIITALLLVAALLLTCAACGKQVDPESAGEAKTFMITVTYPDGTSLDYPVSTEKAFLGAALRDIGFIQAGENGVYVTVDGVTADYEADGTYWAFYINGEYAMTGLDETLIEPDTAYELAYTK